MKFVFLSHDGNCTGGAQKCLVDLLKGIRLKYPDSKIYVIFPNVGDLLEKCLPYIDGFKVISMRWWLLETNKEVSFRKKLSFIYKLLKIALKISVYLRSIKPDYAISNTIVLPHLSLACFFLSIKHIWFIHEIPNTWKGRNFIFSDSTIYKWLDIFSNKVIVPSIYAENFYKQKIPAYKIDVVDQAVEINLESLSQKTIHQCYTLLLVGTFDLNKGQLELLQAIRMIKDSGRDIHCYLVGADAGTLPVCQDFIFVNKLSDNVTILPFTDNIIELYLLADVLIVCSEFETFGRVAVEALKCNLPVILSNVGANFERVSDGVNGFLYKKGDVDDLVCKIELLRDESRRAEFIRQIKKMDFGKYTAIGFANQFCNFIKSL